MRGKDVFLRETVRDKTVIIKYATSPSVSPLDKHPLGVLADVSLVVHQRCVPSISLIINLPRSLYPPRRNLHFSAAAIGELSSFGSLPRRKRATTVPPPTAAATMMRCHYLFRGKLLPCASLPLRRPHRRHLLLSPLSDPSFLAQAFSSSAVTPRASPSPPSLCFRLKRPPVSGRATRPFGTAVAAAAEEGAGETTFHAEEGLTWESLGISVRLSRALSSLSLDRPSVVQAACIPHILSGNDVILAAETGSGKTHGYLVPLFNKLCTISEQSADDTDQVPSKFSGISVVLCPNVMLCEQVVEMANSLCDDLGNPLLKVSSVCGRQGWPIVQPDILVSTPAALLNSLLAFDAENHRRPEFLKSVKHVVFDEADMLLCGSFQNQVIRLIHMFRFQEKVLSRMETPEQGNLESVNEEPLQASECEDNQERQSTCNIEEDEDENSAEDFLSLGNGNRAKGPRDWRRARENYVRSKQYIFVAATLPGSGKKTAGGVLKRMFPTATWVSGNYLHRHNPRCHTNSA
ncbi:hypothetical protein Taro_024633 [Colocasia esculenta]|uniref:Helicase ATP-binding domain-containing protein n=1 Tax=Colocasia esculenta TaxID=4460 RepID=A0A843VBV5_COLES|nr:hypothetical protein [Colocasia esculenta]